MRSPGPRTPTKRLEPPRCPSGSRRGGDSRPWTSPRALRTANPRISKRAPEMPQLAMSREGFEPSTPCSKGMQSDSYIHLRQQSLATRPRLHRCPTTVAYSYQRPSRRPPRIPKTTLSLRNGHFQIIPRRAGLSMLARHPARSPLCAQPTRRTSSPGYTR